MDETIETEILEIAKELGVHKEYPSLVVNLIKKRKHNLIHCSDPEHKVFVTWCMLHLNKDFNLQFKHPLIYKKVKELNKGERVK